MIPRRVECPPHTEFQSRPHDNVLSYEAEISRAAFENARTALRAHSQLSIQARLAQCGPNR